MKEAPADLGLACFKKGWLGQGPVTQLVMSRPPWLPASGAVTLAPAGAHADPGKSALGKISILLGQPISFTSDFMK